MRQNKPVDTLLKSILCFMRKSGCGKELLGSDCLFVSNITNMILTCSDYIHILKISHIDCFSYHKPAKVAGRRLPPPPPHTHTNTPLSSTQYYIHSPFWELTYCRCRFSKWISGYVFPRNDDRIERRMQGIHQHIVFTCPWTTIIEPRHEKTYLRVFRPGKTQTSMRSHRS